MIKLRNASYCNLKLLLIFLVIYGHLIEPRIMQNHDLLVQYRLIYLVHMPLFSFLSGLFLRDCRSCVVQLKRLVPAYVVLQTAAVLFGNGAVKAATPFWYLWYMLSCSYWVGMAWIWFCYGRGKGKFLILILSLITGCLAGCISWIGRAFSLSRTIVFFPYFWMGVLCDKDFAWKKYRAAGAAALLISIILMDFIGDQLKAAFLYQAEPYDDIQSGIVLRSLCYLLGILLGTFLLTCIPDKRYCFTKAGVDTMPAYIFHAPAVMLLRTFHWQWWSYMLVTAVFLWLIYKLSQWHGAMYGIVEGRDRLWQRFRKYTKNMGGRYTGSCYPYPETKP